VLSKSNTTVGTGQSARPHGTKAAQW
jgi:hypothetical protein